MNSEKIPDFSGTKKRAITVYCWSRTVPNTPLWTEAETLGRLAATNGFTVVTGGYCGSMEAVSKGAREVIDSAVADAGAIHTTNESPFPEVIGITVSGIFPDRVMAGNKYLTVQHDSDSMLHRIDQLIRQSRYFVILPGTLGTLQELTSIWMQSVLQPASTDRPVIIAFRDPWERCIRSIAECLKLPLDQAGHIRFVDSAEEAMALILEDAASRSPAIMTGVEG